VSRSLTEECAGIRVHPILHRQCLDRDIRGIPTIVGPASVLRQDAAVYALGEEDAEIITAAAEEPSCQIDIAVQRRPQ